MPGALGLMLSELFQTWGHWAPSWDVAQQAITHCWPFMGHCVASWVGIQLDLLILWAKGRKGNIAWGMQAEAAVCEWRQRGGAGSQGVSQRQSSTVVTQSWGWRLTQPGRVPAVVTSCRPNSRLRGLLHSIAFAQTAFGGCFRDRWHFILAVIYQSHLSKLWLQGN